MPSKRDMNSQLCKMMELLIHLGPSINEVAERLSEPKETVRYRFKHLLINRGLSLHAVPNFRKLGFRHLIIVAAFTSLFRPHADVILAKLHECCYVTAAERTAIEGWFIIQVSVPHELSESCADIFEQLKILGVFSDFEIYRFQHVRTPPMKYHAYDFETGIWTQEGSSNEEKVTIIRFLEHETEPLDKTDLQILKELQGDANRKLLHISQQLGVSYRKILWHYTTHVLGKGLIDSYAVNWTKRNQDSKKEEHEKSYRYLPMCLFLKNAGERVKLGLMAMVQRSPFLWLEASGTDYFALLYLPLTVLNEFFSQLRDLNIEHGQLKYFILNESNTVSYGLNHQLFDDKTKRWQLRLSEVMKKFENLRLEIRNN